MRTATSGLPRGCSYHHQIVEDSTMATIHCITECPPLPEVEGVAVRHCPGFVGYAIGDDGSVWSCHNNRWLLCDSWRRLKPQVGTGGYWTVTLCRHQKRHTRKVATLVALTFLGPRPGKQQVLHYDGTRTNDCLNNLRWGTQSENTADSVRHGTALFIDGESHPNTSLTNNDVRIIRKMFRYCEGKEIASLFRISTATVSRIRTRVSWTSVSG